jgi:hypothetical protein
MNYLYIRGFGHYPMDVPKNYRNIIVFRAIIGYVGVQGMWASVKYMPVGTAACIF